MDLHLHPVGENSIFVEVIDSAGVELGLLCSDGQVLLGGTRNLAADRLRGKHGWWATSSPSSLVEGGTSRPLVRAEKAEIPGFLPSSSCRAAGEVAFPLHAPDPSICRSPRHPRTSYPPLLLASWFPPALPTEGQLHHRGQGPSLVPHSGPPLLPPLPGADKTTGTAVMCVPRLCTAG